MKQVLVVGLLFVCNAALAAIHPSGNGIVISDISGSSQKNSPETVTRFFKQGEIPHYAQAVVNSMPLLTQCDVKNRWQDGSVKFAIISFVVPQIDSQEALITFRDQVSGNNTGYLTEADMLGNAYNFEATMNLSAFHLLVERSHCHCGDR
jgi:hypothetical protein